MNETHANTQSSGAHRKIAVSSDSNTDTLGTSATRRGVFKRAHGGKSKFQSAEKGDFQQDLFEKIIPIEVGPDHVQEFEIKIQHQAPKETVGHELDVPPKTTWKRIKGALSTWLRHG